MHPSIYTYNVKPVTLRFKLHIIRSTLLILALIVLSDRQGNGQNHSNWQPTSGPPGGSVYSFLTLRSNVLIAGTESGTYLSIDNGHNWTSLGEASLNARVQALMATQTGMLFAGTNKGLYRSTDEGTSWSRLNTGLDSTSFTSMAQGDGRLFAGGSGGIIWSEDEGDTWTPINEGLNELQITALEYTPVGDVLAGTESEGMFRLLPLATEWEEVNEGLSRFTDRTIYTIKQFDQRRLIIGTDSGVFLSDADFIAWDLLVRGLGDEASSSVIDVAIDEAGMLYAATPHAVHLSTDEGVNWTVLQQGLPDIDPSLRRLNVLHLATNDEVISGTVLYGVYRLLARSQLWEASTTGLNILSVCSIIVNTNGQLMAGTEPGLFVSTDQGNSWNQTVVLEDLSSFELLFQDTDREGRLFASTTSLLTSTDLGVTWLPILSEQVDAFYVMHDNTYIANVHGTNTLRVSTNEGETWTEGGAIAALTDPYEVYSFIQDAQGRLIAGTSTGLFKSSNKGQSWEPIPLENTIDMGRGLAIDATGQIYAGGFQALYKSDTMGENWSRVLEIESTVVDILNGSLVVTSKEGIYRSSDGGNSWMLINEGLPENAEIRAAAVNPSSVNTSLDAYLAIENKGIYQKFISEPVAVAPQAMPNEFVLSTYPNPFTSSLTIRLKLETSEHIEIHIIDSMGRTVESLLDIVARPGNNEFIWSPNRLAAGIYFIDVKTGTERTLHPVVNVGK